MSAATLLLPARAQLAARLPESLARVLGRADHLPVAAAGERAQLLRHFHLLPRGWPVAALTRELDAGDAAANAWLRADPAWVRPDINGARLMAAGQMLQLDRQDALELLPALQPLCGDFGFPIDAPSPDRWYLRLPREAKLPTFASPEEALGADMFEHMVGTDESSPEMRRWRALASEIQVVLHNHPWNARRAAMGKPPVNALWLWGAGVLPDHVESPHARLQSDDMLLWALAKAAGVKHAELSAPERTDNALYDLRGHAAGSIIEAWLEPLLANVAGGALRQLTLDFADGTRMQLERGQRWRFWRKPLRSLGA